MTSSNLLRLALKSSSVSLDSKLRNLWWFCCWLIIAAIEKFVIFDKAAAAVDRVGEEAWFPISIFPFKTMFGEDEGSGELEGLAEFGLVGDGKEYSFKWNNDLLLVWCILLKRKYVTYLYVCMFAYYMLSCWIDISYSTKQAYLWSDKIDVFDVFLFPFDGGIFGEIILIIIFN